MRAELPLLFVLLTFGAVAGTSGLGFAHKLSVFAWVEGDTVVVEGKLGSGKRPKTGTVFVYDGQDRLILKTKVETDGTARFPLKDYETGLKIVMGIGQGHQSYWILTPYDIESQLEGKKQ